jgi:hypothetical protein
MRWAGGIPTPLSGNWRIKRPTRFTHAAEYWDERCEMMQTWADQLDQWRDGAVVIQGKFPSGQTSEAVQ